MVVCYHCKKKGHTRNECRQLAKKKNQKSESDKSAANVVQQQKADEFLFMIGSHTSGWILDSGATCHISCRRELFIDFDDTHSENVSVANGQQVKASGKGTVIVYFVNSNGRTNKVTITNVLYVPEIGGNLISVKRLGEKGFKVTFKGDTCELWTADNKLQIGIGNIVNNLYQMRLANRINLVTNKQRLCVHEWHRILGHRNIDVVKSIPKSGLVNGMELASCKPNCSYAAECDVCVQGKMTRLPFPKESKHRSTQVLNMIHSDICGPMQTATATGKRYILTFIDDFSRYSQIYLLKEKSEAFQKFKEFHEHVQSKFGLKIKRIRTDRGGEYVDKEFVHYLNTHGIEIQRTAPYTPQQNGVAERKNRTLMEMARCMLLDAGLEHRFWGEAVTMANCLQNLLPWKAVKRTPFELWHGQIPFYSNLRRFGARLYVRIQDMQRRKLDPKAEEGFLVGFDAESKAYRCYIPEKQKVIISRDVKFMDDTIIKDGAPKKVQNTCIAAEKNVTETYVNLDLNDSDFDENVQINDNRDQETEDTLSLDDTELADDLNDTATEFHTPAQTPRRSDRINKGIPPKRLIEEISVIINGEPSNFNEAISCQGKENWMIAMEEEYASLINNKTWELVDLPDGKNLVGCKWVYKLKTSANGYIKKHKARLVAQGFSQKFGVDYDQVFAPVARHSTFRILLSIAASKNMNVYHFDAKTAFLNGDLQEEIYMRQPPGFVIEGAEEKVCRLNKSLYGLKQSARVWNEKLHTILTNSKLIQSKNDSCLYTYHGSQGSLYVLVYVDDILLVSASNEYMQKMEEILKKSFRIENLGLIAEYLGIHVTKQDNSYFLDQEKYIVNVASKFELDKSKPVDIPLSPSYHCEPNEEKLSSNEKYRAAIGCLLYIATNTRPDIAAAVTILSQRVANPSQTDWMQTKKLIRYIKGTSGLRLKIGSAEESKQLVGYADANWAEDRETRKSNSGYIFILNGSITWSCKRQDCVALSSTEAEFIALSEACKESAWIQRLLSDLNWKGNKKTVMYEDNQSVLKMIAEEKFSNRSKHIDTKVHFVKDYVDKGIVEVEFCPTEQMLADMFTKGLAKGKFETFRDLCNLVNLQ